MANFSDPCIRKADDYWSALRSPYAQGMHPQTRAIQEEMQRLQDSYITILYDSLSIGPRTASENKTKPTQTQNLILLLCN